jgi:acyl-CoA synthetase (AMP-forming)/AMP-acid ligase II
VPAEAFQSPGPLRAWLARFAANDVVWTDGLRDWQAGEVVAWLGAAEGHVSAHLRGRTLALAIRSHPQLARLLALLDGRAAALLLVPADWPETAWPGHFRTAGVERLVTDGPAPAGIEVESVPASALLDSPPSPTNTPPAPPVSTRLVIPTSGTTGTPKLVSHSWATLTRTVKTGMDAVCRRWGLLYELTRFAGLQVFLQALASRATLIFTEHLAELEAKLALLAAQGCDALSATPTLWRKILMSPAGRRLPLRQITLGGEIADDLVLGALARTFSQARITHIYASTEAGVGFSVKDSRAGFPATYLTEPPGGVELRVDGEGRLWLRPAVRGQFFVGAPVLEGADGWIDSGDLVERRGDRYYFLGRANGAINVGGDKVFPEEVERVILELPDIALARVSGRRNPIVGALVEATVVPGTPGADAVAISRRVREHCASRLPRFKVPAVIQVVPALATEGTGKLARR